MAVVAGDENKPQFKSSGEILKEDELIRTLPRVAKEALPLQPLWGNFLYKKAITSVIGDPGAGKTTMGYGLTGTLCLNQSYLDIQPDEPVKALVMDFESADSLVTSRVMYVFDTPDIPNLWIYNSPNYYFPQVMELTGEFCKKNEVNLIIVDNQTMAFATRDENDNSEAAKQMRMLRQFVNWTNCAMILFHHTSKANLEGTRKGTGAFARARMADICINLNLVYEDDPSLVYLEMVKNRFSTEDKMLWYLKKIEGKFVRTTPPLGMPAKEEVNTMIYKAQVDILTILRNGEATVNGIKFIEIQKKMLERGYSETWADHGLRRLLQQNRVWRPLYGYWAAVEIHKKEEVSQ